MAYIGVAFALAVAIWIGWKRRQKEKRLNNNDKQMGAFENHPKRLLVD